jgi:DNA-directed RNA polymerase specialized sigma24 family protein
VSPLTVRRYRAERMLRKEFEALRGRVTGTVRGRLRASGVSLDASDLEACYAQAWQGLYAAMLAGEEIANPTGWLALVTFRRAIEEHRSRRRSYPTEGVGEADGLRGGHAAGGAERALEHDFAGELDDRARLRQLFEGLRGRLSARELQAAALCYLQGLSRAEAAARMGISEARMRKLMDGPGPGRPGVAGKVGELVETIRAGGWCEEQGSLMRGLAFGILDPEGERYQLALAHRRECPACRAYVLSLRGLAAVLPPVPALIRQALGGGAAAGAGAGAHASAGHAGAGVGGGGVSAAGAGVGAAGAGGAAGGGWFLAGGGIGAKLAVGCLFVAFGAGCVALTGSPIVPRHAVHHRHVAHVSGNARAAVAGEALSSSIAGAQPVSATAAPARGGGASSSTREGATASLPPAAKASREFGPEQALAGSPTAATAPASSAVQRASSARAASVGGGATGGGASSAGEPTTAGGSGEFGSTATQASAARSSTRSSAGATGAGGNAAQREFGIG